MSGCNVKLSYENLLSVNLFANLARNFHDRDARDAKNLSSMIQRNIRISVIERVAGSTEWKKVGEVG